MLEATSFIPGWYGKIPSLGDFASRRLAQPFVFAWDAWLQQAIAASRADLGQRWLDVYLLSPIWRFALLPGVIGPNAWAGLVMPSVDNVGRHFPLTLAVSLGRQAGTATAMLAAQEWYDGLEKVALATLDTGVSPEQLEANLAGLPFSDPETQSWDAAARKLAHWCQQNPSPACSIALPAFEMLPSVWTAAAHDLLAGSAEGRSLWWTHAESAGQARLCCFVGLPPEEQFANLLEGTILSGETSRNEFASE